MSEDKVYFEAGSTGYFIVDLNASGYGRDKVDVVDQIRKELENKSNGYTDVFIIAHGWNTGREDDRSIRLVNLVVPELESLKPKNTKALYVAVKWPSTIGSVLERGRRRDRREFEKLIKELRGIANDNTLAASSVDDVEKAAQDFANPTVDPSGAFAASPDDGCLPMPLKKGICKLVNELNNDEHSLLDDCEFFEKTITLEMIEKRYQEISRQHADEVEESEEQVDPSAAFGLNTIKSGLNMGRRVVDVARTIADFVFGTFERRAAIVGSRGVHALFADLMRSAEKHVRFHGYGHSLGAHVIQAGAIGRGPSSLLTRKIHSLLLVQAATPSKSLAIGGAYRPLVTHLRPVAGPILATVSRLDEILLAYRIYSTTPVGRVGFEGTEPVKFGDVDIEDKKEGEAAQRVPFGGLKCYNLKSRAVIDEHSDVSVTEIMDIFWQAANVKLDESQYVPTDPKSLPKNYWTDQNVRMNATEL